MASQFVFSNKNNLTVTCVKVALIFFAFFVLSCKEQINGSINANIPPTTTLFVQSSDTLNFTTSTQTLHWDGSDADGFIQGFFYTFKKNPTEQDWTWTTERSKTFALTINGVDTIYSFSVKAVDNLNAEDPTPATQLFPIINSPPEINWQLDSNIPDTTFTVASFAWTVTDLDGENTIAFFEYAIDDTNSWTRLDGDKRSITLKETDGIIAGDHIFYIRAIDIAGTRSPVIHMPEENNKTWHVIAPKGRYLLIDDYEVETSSSGLPDAYYKSMLNSILPTNGDDFSYWNIEKQFPSSIKQFTETLLLFDRVIWYTDLISETDAHFVAAQIAIPEFRKIPGNKIIYTVQFNSNFGTQGEPLDFSPVDSLGTKFNFIATNSIYYQDSTFTNTYPDIVLPELSVSSFIVGLISLKPKLTSIPLYRYDLANSQDDPIFIMLGENEFRTTQSDYDFIFAGTPMHFLNGNNNLEELFSIILNDIF